LNCEAGRIAIALYITLACTHPSAHLTCTTNCQPPSPVERYIICGEPIKLDYDDDDDDSGMITASLSTE